MIAHKPFIFMRHGETDWNKEHRIMGSRDIPLNEKGKTQAYSIVEAIKSASPSYIVSSPLLRAKETANVVGHALNLTVTTRDGLKECNWGKAEGIITDDSPVILYLAQNRSPINGEDVNDFRKRVLSSINDILTRDGLPIIIAHGGIYWAIMEDIGYEGQDAGNTVPCYFQPPASSHERWVVTPICLS